MTVWQWSGRNNTRTLKGKTLNGNPQSFILSFTDVFYLLSNVWLWKMSYLEGWISQDWVFLTSSHVCMWRCPWDNKDTEPQVLSPATEDACIPNCRSQAQINGMGCFRGASGVKAYSKSNMWIANQISNALLGGARFASKIEADYPLWQPLKGNI